MYICLEIQNCSLFIQFLFLVDCSNSSNFFQTQIDLKFVSIKKVFTRVKDSFIYHIHNKMGVLLVVVGEDTTFKIAFLTFVQYKYYSILQYYPHHKELIHTGPLHIYYEFQFTIFMGYLRVPTRGYLCLYLSLVPFLGVFFFCFFYPISMWQL